MSLLSETLKRIDESSEYIDPYELEEMFISLLKSLEEINNPDELNLARLNYQYIIFTVKYSEGVLPRFTGVDDDDNEQIIPDINAYTTLEFDYLKQRFDDTKYPYLKSQYGLLLLLTKNPECNYKNNQIAEDTCKALLDFCKLFKNTSSPIYIIDSVRNCIGIANQRNLNSYIEDLSKFISSIVFSADNLDVFVYEMLRIIREYFKLLSEHIDIKKLLDHIKVTYKPSDTQRGLLITNILNVSLDLSKKLSIDTEYWTRLLAEKYEQLAEEARQNQRTDVTFNLERALEQYKNLKDETKITGLELVKPPKLGPPFKLQN
jgi:hypothetical protein